MNNIKAIEYKLKCTSNPGGIKTIFLINNNKMEEISLRRHTSKLNIKQVEDHNFGKYPLVTTNIKIDGNRVNHFDFSEFDNVTELIVELRNGYVFYIKNPEFKFSYKTGYLKTDSCESTLKFRSKEFIYYDNIEEVIRERRLKSILE